MPICGGGGSASSSAAAAKGPVQGQGRGAASSAAEFARIYEDEDWVRKGAEEKRDLPGEQARSGLGSREDTTREFRAVLEDFLRDHDITSVVDAGCGHWPSGYQRFVNWQGVHYTGLDIVDTVVAENNLYLAQPEAHGLASATCRVGNVSTPLPKADLLLVKDVLMHLPNDAVQAFLRSNVDVRAPRFRAVLVVQNEVPINLRNFIDIEPGQLLPFDISQPPFNGPFRRVFQWQSDEPKAVHLWSLQK